jgi:hypothetical protein
MPPDKKTRHIKSNNLYIPDITKITNDDIYFQEWYKYSKQFTDPFTFGFNKFHKYSKIDKIAEDGKKKHGLVNLALSYNQKAYYSRQIRKTDYKRHFYATTNKDKLFTTNYFLCSVMSSILDIDYKVDENTGECSTPDDIKACRQYLEEPLPFCYYSPSTNGRGLHYRILIDCESIKKIGDKYPNMNYTDNVNKLLNQSGKNNDRLPLKQQSLISVLKKNIESKFFVKVDGFKATYSSYYWSKIYNVYVPSNMGNICLLPRPSINDFHYLINSKIYSISELKEIKLALTDTNNRGPCRTTSVLSSKKINKYTPSIYITIILSHFRSFYAKNGDYYGVGQWVFREIWRSEKRNPTRDEVRKALKQLGKVDEEKMKKLYKCISRRFKKEKLELGKYIDRDTKRYEKIDIAGSLERYGNSYTKLNITAKKIAIGMDYIKNTITGGVECKKNKGKELTVSTDYMGSYSMKLWKKGLIKKKDKWAQPQVSRAIRYMLEDFGDIEKLDASSYPGTSMRYMVSPQYHAYQEVEDHVDINRVNRIRTKGMASMQDWDSMGSTA